ncbi:MAG: division/cell wall cluster transcriptional repressor MraZ [Rhodospirillaceae bacterium]|nr:MAG: division/cell wall cluster transcriptional repressor MraZ [Rhodospirillaceae bacterium]
MKTFIGTFVNKIDAKGRISVPAPFRMVVQAKGLAGIALYPSLTDPCIEGCGLDRIETLAESLPDDALPGVKQDAIAHLIIGTARETPFDGGGRIVLPEDFMAKAGLTDKGAFVGKGRSFQIWEPAALADAQAAMMRRLAAARRAELDGSGGPGT